MEKSTQMGRNRTGIDMSPIDSKEMIRGSENYAPSQGNGLSLSAIERDYIQHSEAVGSVPIPGTIKGALKSVMDKVSGRNPEMLINKLGERLAYERSGVRIYESFITKCETAMAQDPASQQIPMDQLREIRDQEAQHFQLLKESIESLGADPTAQTPDADMTGVASMGLMKVVMDSRTTVSQSLEAMLSIELTDNAAWELLIKLAEDMGLTDMSNEFRRALHQEEIHLQRIRQWYEQSVRSQAGTSATQQH